MNSQFEVYPATSSTKDDFATQDTYKDPAVPDEHPAVTYEHSDRDATYEQAITHEHSTSELAYEETAPTVTYEQPTTDYYYEQPTTDSVYEQPSTDYSYEQPTSDYEQVTSEYERADELTTYPTEIIEQSYQGIRNIKHKNKSYRYKKKVKVPFLIVEI